MKALQKKPALLLPIAVSCSNYIYWHLQLTSHVILYTSLPFARANCQQTELSACSRSSDGHDSVGRMVIGVLYNMACSRVGVSE
jgi:hypothetical protein